MNTPASYNEKNLLAQLREGSENAFTQLYRRHSVKLFYNILSLVKDETAAEELLQDIFVNIWLKKESIQVNENFTAYLFTISRNRVIDFFRKLKRESDLYKRIMETAIEGYSYIEEILLSKENNQLLQKAIESMSPQRKQVFQLCKLQGLPYKEVSERLGISLSTVKDHMAKARLHIRDFIYTNHQELLLGISILLLFHTHNKDFL